MTMALNPRGLGPQIVPVVGYIRSSPGEPVAVLRAQAGVIDRAVRATQQQPQHYRLLRIFRDEGKERPTHLRQLKDMLSVGEARVLLVPRWDRIAPTPTSRRRLREHSRAYGWKLHVLDDADDGSAAGRGSLRSTRTIEGLAEARARGVRLGRPRQAPVEVLVWAAALRGRGLRCVDVAALFTRAQIPTPGGQGPWQQKTVSRMLGTRDGRTITTWVDGSSEESFIREVAAAIADCWLAGIHPAPLVLILLIDGEIHTESFGRFGSFSIGEWLRLGKSLLRASIEN